MVAGEDFTVFSIFAQRKQVFPAASIMVRRRFPPGMVEVATKMRHLTPFRNRKGGGGIQWM